MESWRLYAIKAPPAAMDRISEFCNALTTTLEQWGDNVYRIYHRDWATPDAFDTLQERVKALSAENPADVFALHYIWTIAEDLPDEKRIVEYKNGEVLTVNREIAQHIDEGINSLPI